MASADEINVEIDRRNAEVRARVAAEIDSKKAMERDAREAARREGKLRDELARAEQRQAAWHGIVDDATDRIAAMHPALRAEVERIEFCTAQANLAARTIEELSHELGITRIVPRFEVESARVICKSKIYAGRDRAMRIGDWLSDEDPPQWNSPARHVWDDAADEIKQRSIKQ